MAAKLPETLRSEAKGCALMTETQHNRALSGVGEGGGRGEEEEDFRSRIYLFLPLIKRYSAACHGLLYASPLASQPLPPGSAHSSTQTAAGPKALDSKKNARVGGGEGFCVVTGIRYQGTPLSFRPLEVRSSEKSPTFGI
jgi:hypothetical protein